MDNNAGLAFLFFVFIIIIIWFFSMSGSVRERKFMFREGLESENDKNKCKNDKCKIDLKCCINYCTSTNPGKNKSDPKSFCTTQCKPIKGLVPKPAQIESVLSYNNFMNNCKKNNKS